jgi:hypothetical protein
MAVRRGSGALAALGLAALGYLYKNRASLRGKFDQLSGSMKNRGESFRNSQRYDTPSSSSYDQDYTDERSNSVNM